jgi:hypothetical protein
MSNDKGEGTVVALVVASVLLMLGFLLGILTGGFLWR